MERLIKAMDKYLSNKFLTLSVRKQWYDMIVSGEKTEEYREIKPYWMNRLLLIKNEESEEYKKLHVGKNVEMLIDTDTIKEKMKVGDLMFVPFTHVRFINGYRKDSQRIYKEIESIIIGKPKRGMCPDEWLDQEFFIIKFK